MEDDGVTPKGFSTGDIELELKSDPIPTVKFVFADDIPLAGEEVLSSLDSMKIVVEEIVAKIQNALSN